MYFVHTPSLLFARSFSLPILIEKQLIRKKNRFIFINELKIVCIRVFVFIYQFWFDLNSAAMIVVAISYKSELFTQTNLKMFDNFGQKAMMYWNKRVKHAYTCSTLNLIGHAAECYCLICTSKRTNRRLSCYCSPCIQCNTTKLSSSTTTTATAAFAICRTISNIWSSFFLPALGRFWRLAHAFFCHALSLLFFSSFSHIFIMASLEFDQ